MFLYLHYITAPLFWRGTEKRLTIGIKWDKVAGNGRLHISQWVISRAKWGIAYCSEDFYNDYRLILADNFFASVNTIKVHKHVNKCLGQNLAISTILDGCPSEMPFFDSVEIEYSRWPLEVVQIDRSYQLNRNLPFNFDKPVCYSRVLSIVPLSDWSMELG